MKGKSKKLRVAVIDLITKRRTRHLYARFMHANLAGIMPQVVATWCEQEKHEVQYVCFTGVEDVSQIFVGEVDLVFICAFTEAAFLAYAVSNYFRLNSGCVTVLGGPHARCYPEDAGKHFDYVLGLTNRQVVLDILSDCSRHRPLGLHLEADQQPSELPSVQERWKFIESMLQKAPWIKVVPMLSSFGCPYSCRFCIDSVLPYQPLDFELLKSDLQFLLTKLSRPLVAWHDPNFGVRFDETLDAIEEAIPQNSIDFIAESSLSLLSEPRVKRLQKNGFKAVIPGVESWFELGNKSGTGNKQGEEKVKSASERINMILRHIPYVQANFLLGLDSDQGSEPFQLTKKFVDSSPGAFPGYSLLTAFGRAAPGNLLYQRDNRVVAFPFNLLNNNEAMNVRPKHYDWREFYDRLIDLSAYSYSSRAIFRRFLSNKTIVPKIMNIIRSVSAEGWGRYRYFSEIRRRLDTDPQFRPFVEGETKEVPNFYVDQVRNELGGLWHWLPQNALEHDAYAYLKTSHAQEVADSDCGALS